MACFVGGCAAVCEVWSIKEGSALCAQVTDRFVGKGVGGTLFEIIRGLVSAIFWGDLHSFSLTEAEFRGWFCVPQRS